MERYDIFEGVQLKLFELPTYSYYDETLSYAGHSYAEGDAVPWRGMNYNYGKNFLVAHVDPCEDVKCLFVFEGGALKKLYRGDEIARTHYEDFWRYPVYNANGWPLVVTNLDELNLYLDAVILRNNAEKYAAELAAGAKALIDDYSALEQCNTTLCFDAQTSILRLQAEVVNAITKKNRAGWYYAEKDDEIYDYAIKEYGTYIALVHDGGCSEGLESTLLSEAKQFFKVLPHYHSRSVLRME